MSLAHERGNCECGRTEQHPGKNAESSRANTRPQQIFSRSSTPQNLLEAHDESRPTFRAHFWQLRQVGFPTGLLMRVHPTKDRPSPAPLATERCLHPRITP